ncbi:hypothetical protein DYGSA30_40040 [Dyella sp. GSA-30]|nr:hypothetical protein DYGSA30_40040 [Dyella sp. GSA-30]
MAGAAFAGKREAKPPSSRLVATGVAVAQTQVGFGVSGHIAIKPGVPKQALIRAMDARRSHDEVWRLMAKTVPLGPT